MTDTKKMIERIKALLAKASSTDHEAEAEVFFTKAYELMEKYQIDSGDLDKDDPLGNEHVAARKGQAAPDWDFRLMFSVAKYFGCRSIQVPSYGPTKYSSYDWNGHYVDLIGRESARITAIEMHKYLVSVVRRLGREKAKVDSRLNADAWARRIGVALQERLYLLAPKVDTRKTTGPNALVNVDKVLALYDKLHPDARKIKGPGALTNNEARNLANGIGLNLQTGGASQKLLG